MNDAMLSIVSMDVRPEIQNEPDLIKRIEKAFKKVQDFWMSTDDDLRFRGALAAVWVETKDEAQAERLKRSLDAVKALSALLAGVPIDLVAAVDDIGDDPIPLLKMYQEAKKNHA